MNTEAPHQVLITVPTMGQKPMFPASDQIVVGCFDFQKIVKADAEHGQKVDRHIAKIPARAVNFHAFFLHGCECVYAGAKPDGPSFSGVRLLRGAGPRPVARR